MFKTLFTTYRTLYDDFYYTQPLSALFLWIKTKQGSEEWVVCVNLPRQKDLVRIVAGKAIEVSAKGRHASVRIVVCQSGNLEGSLKTIESAKGRMPNWYPLFTSRDLEIWENKNLNETAPLRFGLSGEEKRIALAIARRAAARFLENKKQDSEAEGGIMTNPRFHESTTICVALWIDGKIRGSQIERDVPLCEAIARGGVRACRDSRFKPVIRGELEKARIEITIMSDLKIPLTKRMREKDSIDPTAGYCIEKGDKIGWYVPEVFNAVRFRTLHELINKLATTKAGIPPETGVIATFKVEDFIEAGDGKRYLEMDGPVARQASLDDEIGKNNARDILVSIGTKAASQLLAIQEQDGNIPPIFNPLTGEKKQIGWTQLCCALWGLALFGKTIGKKDFLASAEKGFAYVSAFIYEHPTLSLNTRVASLIYFGRLAKVLDKKEDLKKITASILEYIEKLTSYEPILYANIASFLFEQGANDSNMINKAINFAERVETDYLQQKKSEHPFQLARYPELAMAFLYIVERTGKGLYIEKAKSIFAWLAEQQLENGAFPIGTFGPPAPYSRGTGKIFEVLSVRYEEHKDVILKALSWLSIMQYDEDSLFFVRPELRNMVKGGLRHDYLNQEVWIDGTAHVLIGISRILAQEQKSIPNLLAM